jgi:transposase
LSERKVGEWRNRFAERRLEGLSDLPRPGKPRVYDHDKQVEVIKTACSPPPEGETHWTVRSLAEAVGVGVGKSQTHAFLAEADLKPHQVRSWLTNLDQTSIPSRPMSAALSQSAGERDRRLVR